jgi:hypothetical protein
VAGIAVYRVEELDRCSKLAVLKPEFTRHVG